MKDQKLEIKRLSHEEIARLAEIINLAPWNLDDWEQRVPEEVIPLFAKAVKLMEEFDAANLPYKLGTNLYPR